jgi:hypothetical protein
MNAKEINTSNLKLKVLLYGKSGTGKTTFACSFPRPYIFDFDNGMLSQRGKDVEFDTVTDYGSVGLQLSKLESSCPYETVVLDSITTMQELHMNYILAQNGKKMPTMNEWNILISNTTDLFMRLTALKRHLVVIAHEQLIQDEITGEVLYRPIIAGKKTADRLPLWFDECYRTQIGKTKEGSPVGQLVTTADVKFMAKSRHNCFAPIQDWGVGTKVENPYSYIVERMGGGR